MNRTKAIPYADNTPS